MITLSYQLTQYRQHYGYSIKRASMILGINKSRWTRMEEGSTSPSRWETERLLDFGVISGKVFENIASELSGAWSDEDDDEDS